MIPTATENIKTKQPTNIIIPLLLASTGTRRLMQITEAYRMPQLQDAPCKQKNKKQDAEGRKI